MADSYTNADSENEAELLRRNCVATKMLSVYAKWKGSAYLKTTLQKVLERLIMSSEDLDLELDPARTASPEELLRNALQLRHVTKVFIDDICNSASHVPVSFRKICNIVSPLLHVVFGYHKLTLLFRFLPQFKHVSQMPNLQPLALSFSSDSFVQQ